MISIGIVKSGSAVYQYFIDQDNYYLTDKSELVDGAYWYGKGADKLGIQGKIIEEKLFLDLLEGRIPNGIQIGRMRDGSIKHRPATDITLSAPKSVSTMALVAKDERLIEVHNRAAQKVFDKIEAMYAEARVTENGVTRYEKTGNLIIAAFRHTSSREKDPQLHTHGVTMNATERQDGAWRALSSRQKSDVKNLEHGFREMIYANQHYLGMIYNSEMAKGTTACGYNITVKDKYGNFEIDGIPEAYLKSQSKRRKQIVESLAKRGLSGAKAAQTAALNTRELKESVEPEQLREIWLKEATANGVDLNAVYEQSLQPKTPTINTEVKGFSIAATSAIEDAVNHLSQYSVQLRHGDIIRQAFVFGSGTIDHESLESALTQKLKTGEVIGKADQYYTTKALITIEKQLHETFIQSKGTSFNCNIEASGIIPSLLNHQDRLQVLDVKGLKNEAKLVDQMVKTGEAQGLNVYVVHQNLSRMNHLSDKIKREQSSFWQAFKNYFKHDLMQSFTKFTHDYQNTLNNDRLFFHNKQDLIIIADAQKLSYQNMAHLEQLTRSPDAKVIFLNNTESTQGFQAGNAIQVLKAAGVHQRQSTTQKSKSEIVIAKSTQSLQDLAKHYGTLDQAVPVVALTNKAQKEMTTAIRERLQSLGRLSLQTIEYQSLSNKGLSPIEKLRIQCYHQGDVLMLNPYTKDEQRYVVTGVNKLDNTLTLAPAMEIPKHKIIEKFTLNDQTNFEVKKPQTLEISVGEILSNTRAMRLGDGYHRVNLPKNSTLQVTAIENAHIEVMHNNQAYTMTREQLKNSFIDHGYVVKPHQLKPVNSVLTALSSYQVNQNTIGEIAEFADKVTLFTDNPDKSMKALDKAAVNWTAEHVALGKAESTYAPIVRTEAAIRADLYKVAASLCQNLSDKDKLVEVAVSYGMAKVAEREAGFNRNELIKNALHYALGKFSIDEIEQVIADKERQGEILVSNAMMTTPSVYALEQKIIDNTQSGHNKLTPIFTKAPDLPKQLTQGQRDAVTLALTTQDQFIGINGVAGSGKTSMMKAFKKQAESRGYHLVGIAPTHKAVQMLGESMYKSQYLKDAGITVMTAHSFIGQTESTYNDKTIFIIDECSMLGNRLYHSIQAQVIKLKTRAIFAGDIGQHTSIEHGKPQALAINNGLKTAHMREIVRQSNEILKTSAIFASQTNSEASLRNLEQMNPDDYIKRTDTYAIDEYKESFIEIGIDQDDQGNPIYNHDGLPSIENLYTAVANDWLSRTPEQRDKTIVVACMHLFRNEIDARIRTGLKEEGIIHDTVKTKRLVTKNFDTVDLLLAKNYKPRDIIRFDKTFSIAKKGDHMQVIEVDAPQNKLKISNLTDDNVYTINPAKLAVKAEMSVYDHVSAELGIGDRIRLRMSDKTKGWVGGSEYSVKKITPTKALLKNDLGELVIKLDDQKDQLWDYAYTHTSYSVQGASAKYMIGLEVNDNYRSNYIQITRAKEHLTIYTIDKQWLIEHLTDPVKMQKADKVSAYEVMAEKRDEATEAQKVSVSKENEAAKALSKKPEQILEKRQKNTEEIQPQQQNEQPLTVKTKPVLAADIKPLLNAQIESLALTLLGEPNKKLSKKTQWRYGNKGSFVLNTKTGVWYSHETGEKGNAFDLIQKELGMRNFKDVLDYAKNFVHYTPDTIIAKAKPLPKITDDDKVHKDKMKAHAAKLFAESKDLTGTLGEKYLHETRGLNHYREADIRFLPKAKGQDANNQWITTPAILSFAKDHDGKINHVQIIRLNSQGQKHPNVKMAKQTYGTMNGYAIELNQGAAVNKKCTYLSEGVETGLSILNVKQNAHVMAVLGASNFKNINTASLADKVIICLDNDFKTQATKKQIDMIKNRVEQFKAVVARLNAEGKQVKFALPHHAGFDFNDVLKQQSYIELSKQLNAIFTLKDYQKITDDYIQNNAKIIESNLKKSIDNYQNETVKLKDNAIILPEKTHDNHLKNIKIDNHAKHISEELLQKNKDYSAVKKHIDAEEMGRFRNSEVVHNTPTIQPTKPMDNQKGFER